MRKTLFAAVVAAAAVGAFAVPTKAAAGDRSHVSFSFGVHVTDGYPRYPYYGHPGYYDDCDRPRYRRPAYAPVVIAPYPVYGGVVVVPSHRHKHHRWHDHHHDRYGWDDDRGRHDRRHGHDRDWD